MRSARSRFESLRRLPPARAARPRDAARAGNHRRRPRSWRGAGDATSGPWSALLLGSRRFASRLLDGLSDAGIGAAAANVPRQRLVDIGIGGRRYLREQRRGSHDLAGLAVAALYDLQVEPGLLNPLAGTGGADSLDRGDRMSRRGADRHHAGSSGNAIQMHRARAAESDAAAELGSVHA